MGDMVHAWGTASPSHPLITEKMWRPYQGGGDSGSTAAAPCVQFVNGEFKGGVQSVNEVTRVSASRRRSASLLSKGRGRARRGLLLLLGLHILVLMLANQ